MTQIFISHSRRDEQIRNFFDSIFAGTNVRAVRVEFENFEDTPSNFIKDNIFASEALFVLLGPNVNISEFTVNWIGFEVGLAAAWNKEIWVFEQLNTRIPFPIPFLSDYVLYDLGDPSSRTYITGIVDAYNAIMPILRQLPQGFRDVTCDYPNCRMSYRLHAQINSFNCPACRQPLQFVE